MIQERPSRTKSVGVSGDGSLSRLTLLKLAPIVPKSWESSVMGVFPLGPCIGEVSWPLFYLFMTEGQACANCVFQSDTVSCSHVAFSKSFLANIRQAVSSHECRLLMDWCKLHKALLGPESSL